MLLYQCCALLNRNADNWPLFCLQPSCPVTPGGRASLTGDTPQVIANSPYPRLDRWKQKLVIANSPYPSFPAVMGCENCWTIQMWLLISFAITGSIISLAKIIIIAKTCNPRDTRCGTQNKHIENWHKEVGLSQNPPLPPFEVYPQSLVIFCVKLAS